MPTETFKKGENKAKSEKKATTDSTINLTKLKKDNKITVDEIEELLKSDVEKRPKTEYINQQSKVNLLGSENERYMFPKTSFVVPRNDPTIKDAIALELKDKKLSDAEINKINKQISDIEKEKSNLELQLTQKTAQQKTKFKEITLSVKEDKEKSVDKLKAEFKKKSLTKDQRSIINKEFKELLDKEKDVIKQNISKEKIQLKNKISSKKDNIKSFESDLKTPKLTPEERQVVIDRLQAIEDQKLIDYKKDEIVPFYTSGKSRELVPLESFDELPKKSIVYEKPDSIKFGKLGLTEDEKKRSKELEELLKNSGSTSGHKLQTQVLDLSLDPDLNYHGNFNTLGMLNKMYIPTKFIMVDNDDIGNLIAFETNMYGGKENYFDNNVYFQADQFIKGEDPKRPNELKVSRAYGKSIVNSITAKQNSAIRLILEGFLDIRAEDDKTDKPKPFFYIDPNGKPQDLTISNQLVEMSYEVFTFMKKNSLEVQVSDIEQTIIFPDYELADYLADPDSEDAPDIEKPVLEFQSTTTEKTRRLDTDTIIRAIVRKMNLEPDSAQKRLEALHNQGWITYPRIKDTDLEQEKMNIQIIEQRIIDPITKEERDRDIKDYKGTNIEKQILEIIDTANKTKDQDFANDGVWLLKSGDTILSKSKPNVVFAGEPNKYTEDQFDIRIGKDRGIPPEEFISFLSDNKIGTPATRTHQLSRLKNAGVLSLVNDRYVLDARGLFIASIKQVYDAALGENYFRLQMDAIQTAESPAKIAKIVNDYKSLKVDFFKKWIKQLGTVYVEAEDDLAELESY